MDHLIRFRWWGRFAHFLKAESGVTCLSYPVPPRTAIIGLIGTVLGLDKDQPQELLQGVGITLEGSMPLTHWHKAKLRKDPPQSLNHIIKAKQSGRENVKPEKATLIRQEWMYNPEYIVGVVLPEPYGPLFAARVIERRWHYTPCLGLSELLADLEYLETVSLQKLDFGSYKVQGVVRQDLVKVDVQAMYEERLSIRMLRMPREVTVERVFRHAPYLLETDGRAFTVETQEAWGEVQGERVWSFM